MPSSKVASPAFVAEIKLSGSITIQRADASDLLAVGGSKEKLILSNKREADLALNKLVTQNEIGWNPETKEITFENGITINSNIPYAPSFTVAANISSTTGLPGIKATASCAPIKGKIEKHLYAIADLGIEIELTPRPPSANPKPVPVPVKPTVTVRKPNWDYLTGVVLIASAGLLVAATIGEDIITAGVGTADDAPSFAAASAIFATGLAMTRSVTGQQPIKMEHSEL